MPFGSLHVIPHLDIKIFIFYIKTWSEHPSGQIATSTGFCHSRSARLAVFCPWRFPSSVLCQLHLTCIVHTTSNQIF